MNEAWRFGGAFAIGGMLGAIFFAGLWWTVQKAVSSKRPALWLLGSLFARTAIVLGGFYFVANGDWRHLLVCLLGFVAARMGILCITRPENQAARKEPEHAS